jgi:succinate dehydrogenase/fumarate reductase flavoprotein subunit
MQVDVVVVGSGGAGLSAAVVAAKRGCRVLVVEKTEYFGGATAMSGGGTWIPCNSLAAHQGLGDSLEGARGYIEKVVGPDVRADVLRAFLEKAPAMLDFMLANTEVRFAVAPFSPDYHPALEGASLEGRMLSPCAYDGRKLGAYFSKLRPPLAEFNAPAGMMLDLADMPHVLNPFGSLESFVHVLRMVLRAARDRLSYPRGTHLTMGNALAARLLRSALDAGVELWNNAPMKRLVRENGRISAIEIEKDRETIRVEVRRGIVLASGGFSANPEMRARYIPFSQHHISLMPSGNTGDGLRAAQEVGAGLDEGNKHNAAWTVISMYPRRDGSLSKWPHLFLDRPKPGFIIVNERGERFGDEASLNFVAAMHRSGAVPAHIVCDAQAIRKYGLGAVLPGGWRLRRLLKAGYIIEAPSLADLAAKIGVDPGGLERTAAKMNEYARAGHDPDFAKGSSAFDCSIGDYAHKPNPCLGPVQTPPFYAVKINPGDATTTLGLKTDGRSRVLDAGDRPIAGLYACGLDMNSLWRGEPPGNGANNTLSLTFGFIAGNELASLGEQAGLVNAQTPADSRESAATSSAA